MRCIQQQLPIASIIDRNGSNLPANHISHLYGGLIHVLGDKILKAGAVEKWIRGILFESGLIGKLGGYYFEAIFILCDKSCRALRLIVFQFFQGRS